MRTKVIPALKAVGLAPIFQATDEYVKTTIDKDSNRLEIGVRKRRTSQGDEKRDKGSKDRQVEHQVEAHGHYHAPGVRSGGRLVLHPDLVSKKDFGDGTEREDCADAGKPH